MTTDGYIRMPVDLLDHDALRVADGLGVFSKLLLWAAVEPRLERIGDETVYLEAGQLAIVEEAWSERLGLSLNRLRAILIDLARHNLIDVEDLGEGAFTVVTIHDFATYLPTSGE